MRKAVSKCLMPVSEAEIDVRSRLSRVGLQDGRSASRIRVRAALFTAATVLSIGVSSTANGAETLTLSSYLFTKHWLVAEVITGWTKDVEKATNGDIKINILQTALGKPEAHFDIASAGIADFTLSVPGYSPGRFVLTMVGAQPNMGNTAESASGALWRVLQKYPEMQEEFKGVLPLAAFTTTGLQYWSKERPIENFESFKGMKMHQSGGAVAAVAAAIGAIPVTQPTATAHQVISSGVVDGIIFTTNGIDALKLSKILKYGLLIPGGFSKGPITLVANPAKFNGLSKSNQRAIMQVSGEKLSRAVGRTWEKKDEISLVNVRKDGVKVRHADPALRDKIFDTAGKAVDAWLQEVKDKRGMDGRRLLTDARREAKEIEAGQ